MTHKIPKQSGPNITIDITRSQNAAGSGEICSTTTLFVTVRVFVLWCGSASKLKKSFRKLVTYVLIPRATHGQNRFPRAPSLWEERGLLPRKTRRMYTNALNTAWPRNGSHLASAFVCIRVFASRSYQKYRPPPQYAWQCRLMCLCVCVDAKSSSKKALDQPLMIKIDTPQKFR